MENQELLNKFYYHSKEVKANQHKCLKLTDEELSIITKALALLPNTNLEIAEKDRQVKLKEIDEYIENNPI